MIVMISMYTYRDGNNGRRVYLLTITIVTLKKRKQTITGSIIILKPDDDDVHI